MIGRVLKYWQRLWKTEEMSLMGDASKTKLVWKTEDHLFCNELKSSWKTIIHRSTCNLLPCLASSHSSFTKKKLISFLPSSNSVILNTGESNREQKISISIHRPLRSYYENVSQPKSCVCISEQTSSFHKVSNSVFTQASTVQRCYDVTTKLNRRLAEDTVFWVWKETISAKSVHLGCIQIVRLLRQWR